MHYHYEIFNYKFYRLSFFNNLVGSVEPTRLFVTTPATGKMSKIQQLKFQSYLLHFYFTFVPYAWISYQKHRKLVPGLRRRW